MLSKPVFHIESAEHWVELCRRYPADVSASRRGAWFETTGREGLWVQPDWEAVARDYDGIHLSLVAYLAFAGEVLEVSEEYSSVIAGWNPGETYWFTDSVNRTGAEEHWCIEERGESEGWHRQQSIRPEGRFS